MICRLSIAPLVIVVSASIWSFSLSRFQQFNIVESANAKIWLPHLGLTVLFLLILLCVRKTLAAHVLTVGAVLAFLSIAAYWTITGRQSIDTYLRLVQIVNFPVIFWATAFLAHRLSGPQVGSLINIVTALMLASISLGAVVTLLGYVAFAPVDSVELIRLVSPFGGPIATGAVLIVVAVVMLDRAIKKKSLLAYVLLGVVLALAVLTGSRLVLASALLGTFLVVLLSAQTLLSRVTVSSLLVILIVGAIVVAGHHADVGFRAISTIGSGGGDVQRFFSVTTGLRAAMDNPVFGAGLGSFYDTSFTSPLVTFRIWNIMTTKYGMTLLEPHNLLIFLLAEGGIITCLVYFIVAFVAPAVVGVRQGLHGTVIVAGLVALMLHQMGGSHLIINQAVSSILALTFGLFAARVKR